MDIPATIRKIKTELRLAMNGVASAYMRENGMNYKLNFGVELPRLRAIAAEFPADHDLAQALWKEDIRECKLLAAMLQPTGTFYPEIADIWVESMPNAEIAQHTVQNLFCRLPYASQKAYEWIASEDEMFQQCGYLILHACSCRDSVPTNARPTSFSTKPARPCTRPSPCAAPPSRPYRNTRHWTKRHERPGKKFSGKPESELSTKIERASF